MCSFWADIGRVGGIQTINLGSNCLSCGNIFHGFMHALGFHHEQLRADRDDFIRINWKNIPDGNYGTFIYCANELVAYTAR
jgi:Astacin (Peptidase family M12A)